MSSVFYRQMVLCDVLLVRKRRPLPPASRGRAYCAVSRIGNEKLLLLLLLSPSRRRCDARDRRNRHLVLMFLRRRAE